MADEEIIIRTRLEDAGVVEQLERQARAVEDLQRRAGASSRIGGAAAVPDWMGESPALARLRAQAERVTARAADLQRTAGEIEARAAAEQAAGTARLNSLLASAGTAARLTGNWQAGSALHAMSNLSSTAGGATMALLGVVGGLAILGTVAGRAITHMGELAIKVDTLARGGAHAKTSMEQAAAAAERLQIGLGRYVAPALDALNTQRAALLSTLAQQTGRQTIDEAVQNALARERAAQQRLEAARRTWAGVGPAEQEQVRISYAQAVRAGMGMPVNPFGAPFTTSAAEAEATAMTIERLRAQLAQASAALAAVQAIGGPGLNLREEADWLTGRLQEQMKYVSALKKELADYQALAAEMQEATKRGLRGDRDAAAYAERLAEKLKTVNVDRLNQTLQDAQAELRDLTSREHEVRVKVFWEEYGAIAARRGTAGMLPDVAAQFPGTPFGMINFQEWLALQNLSLTTPSGLGPPLGPDTQFNLQQAPWQEALAYMRYREAQANLPLAAVLSRQVSPPAPPRAAGLDRLESTLRGLIGQGPATAVGLGDLRGGTYGGGPLAPGAGGPFEALYRIQDIAMNWETPGRDTRKWAEMYGLGPEQARSIARQFQMGFFSPEVMKYVDVQALVDTANMMDLAEKSQEALAKELAKRGANPDNIKRLLGIAGKDEKDTSPYRPAVDAMLNGMNAELTNRADSVEATGRRWWGLIERGLVEGARDSDVLLNVLRSLISRELNSMVPNK